MIGFIENEKKEYLISVYGTLRKGFHANNMLKDAEYIGKAITKQRFLMLDIGFPGIVRISDIDDYVKIVTADPSFPQKYLGFVVVEVYKASQEIKDKLDVYEGVPTLYKVEDVDVVLIHRGGKQLKTKIYVYNKKRVYGANFVPVDEYGFLDWKFYKTNAFDYDLLQEDEDDNMIDLIEDPNGGGIYVYDGVEWTRCRDEAEITKAIEKREKIKNSSSPTKVGTGKKETKKTEEKKSKKKSIFVATFDWGMKHETS